MAYRLNYHPHVLDMDLPALDPNTRRRIDGAIRGHLALNPGRIGIPLRRELRGTWKYRIGDHRVVFQIAGPEIRILAIRLRSDVYQVVEGRTT